ncbi:SRPBCC domain-containing protein [Seohaeicola zhoushanensis]
MTDSTLTISRLIRAPRAVVWSAWSDPAHFAKWWLPEPLECKVVKMELRPGGGFETQMREGQGNSSRMSKVASSISSRWNGWFSPRC